MMNTPFQSHCYHPISPLDFWRESHARERAIVITAWLFTLILSIGLGLASIIYEWSGLPFYFGGVTVSVTVYPPLIFCLLWVIWFGFWWGFVPAYLSTLVLALYSGMPLGWSILFAFSDPIGLAVFAIVLRAITVPIDLRSLNSAMLFVPVSFVSGVFGSSGALIWVMSQNIGANAILPIWQGWWLGAFLQNLFIVAPLLYLAGRKVMVWRSQYNWGKTNSSSSRNRVLLMTVILLFGVLSYLFGVIQLTNTYLEYTLQQTGLSTIHNVATIQKNSMLAMLLVVAILISFIAFFAYQLYVLWIGRIKELADSEARYRTLYTNTPVMLHSIDRNGFMVNVSDYWLSHMGYTRDEVIGKKSVEFLSTASYEYALREVLPQFMQTGQCTEVPYQFVRKDGVVLDCLLSAIAEKDAQGNMLRSLAVVMDVTELKKAQQALLTAKSQAENANRIKSEFLANMSHEIRTPMNSILGMAQLALSGEMSIKQREYLRIIRMSGEHLLSILDDILDSAKIEAGKLELEQVDFNLNEVKQKLLHLVGWKAAEKGLKFSIRFAPEIPQRLCGDAMRLTQILINYANNAVKFTEHGSVIISAKLISETEQQAMLRFEVQDTGIGLTQEQKSRLFQIFEQADTSTTRKYGGSGLGLSICKHLVLAMQGEFGVESAIGEGSTFWFMVRLAKVAKNHVLQTSKSSNSPTDYLGLQQARILVVDDNRFNQQVAQEFLQKAGVHVTLANNGKEALALLQQEPFDCVLMDVQMPVMDGLTATRLIRSISTLADIPIIALAANISSNDRNTYLEAGMDDFIGKPFNADHFYNTINKFLAQKVLPLSEANTENLTAGICNMYKLMEIVGDDKVQIRRFADKFIESATQDISAIEAALANRDSLELSRLGHSLKSPAGMVGATRMAALCICLESAKHSLDVEEATKIVAQLRPLLSQFDLEVHAWCKAA